MLQHFVHVNSDDVAFSGTTDRICLITGLAACVRKAHDVIWEKIRSRVDTSKIGIEELQVISDDNLNSLKIV